MFTVESFKQSCRNNNKLALYEYLEERLVYFYDSVDVSDQLFQEFSSSIRNNKLITKIFAKIQEDAADDHYIRLSNLLHGNELGNEIKLTIINKFEAFLKGILQLEISSIDPTIEPEKRAHLDPRLFVRLGIAALQPSIQKAENHLVSLVNEEDIATQLKLAERLQKQSSRMVQIWQYEKSRCKLSLAYRDTEQAKTKHERFEQWRNHFTQMLEQVRNVLDESLTKNMSPLTELSIEHPEVKAVHETQLADVRKNTEIAGRIRQFKKQQSVIEQSFTDEEKIDDEICNYKQWASTIYQAIKKEGERRHADGKRNEIIRFLDLIFGNPEKGIPALPPVRQTCVLNLINMKYHRDKDYQENQRPLYWQQFHDQLSSKYNTKLSDLKFSCKQQVLTSAEAMASSYSYFFLSPEEDLTCLSHPEYSLKEKDQKQEIQAVNDNENWGNNWKQVALKAFSNGGVNALSDLFLATLMRNISPLEKINREEVRCLKALCGAYMGEGIDNNVLPKKQKLAYPNGKTTVSNLREQELPERQRIDYIYKHMTDLLKLLQRDDLAYELALGNLHFFTATVAESRIKRKCNHNTKKLVLLRISYSIPTDVVCLFKDKKGKYQRLLQSGKSIPECYRHAQVRKFIKLCKPGVKHLIDPVTSNSMDPKNIDEDEILSMKSNNEAQQDDYASMDHQLKERSSSHDDFDLYIDVSEIKDSEEEPVIVPDVAYTTDNGGGGIVIKLLPSCSNAPHKEEKPALQGIKQNCSSSEESDPRSVCSAQVAAQHLHSIAPISARTELSRQQVYVVSQEEPQASPTRSSAPSFDTTTRSRLSSTIKEDDGDDINESKSDDSINSSSSSALVTPTSSQSTNTSQHQQAVKGEYQPFDMMMLSLSSIEQKASTEVAVSQPASDGGIAILDCAKSNLDTLPEQRHTQLYRGFSEQINSIEKRMDNRTQQGIKEDQVALQQIGGAISSGYSVEGFVDSTEENSRQAAGAVVKFKGDERGKRRTNLKALNEHRVKFLNKQTDSFEMELAIKETAIETAMKAMATQRDRITALDARLDQIQKRPLSALAGICLASEHKSVEKDSKSVDLVENNIAASLNGPRAALNDASDTDGGFRDDDANSEERGQDATYNASRRRFSMSDDIDSNDAILGKSISAFCSAGASMVPGNVALPTTASADPGDSEGSAAKQVLSLEESFLVERNALTTVTPTMLGPSDEVSSQRRNEDEDKECKDFPEVISKAEEDNRIIEAITEGQTLSDILDSGLGSSTQHLNDALEFAITNNHVKAAKALLLYIKIDKRTIKDHLVLNPEIQNLIKISDYYWERKKDERQYFNCCSQFFGGYSKTEKLKAAEEAMSFVADEKADISEDSKKVMNQGRSKQEVYDLVFPKP